MGTIRNIMKMVQVRRLRYQEEQRQWLPKPLFGYHHKGGPNGELYENPPYEWRPPLGYFCEEENP